MNEKRNGSHPPAAGMALNDIYYVLFRHKWKIIILSVLGFGTAIGIYFYRGTTYQSEANVWIKYVMNTKPSGPTASSSETISLADNGEVIINNELAILNSFDLAKQVATNVGPDKILAKMGGGSDVIQAATVIHDNLLVERFPRSSILRIIYSHPDKDLVQRVLQEVVDDYKTKEQEMYKMDGSFDSLSVETSNLKHELDQAEDNLRRAKMNANISELDDSKKSNGTMILAIHQQILIATTELALHEATLKRLQGNSTDVPVPAVASTNVLPDLTDDQIEEYNQARDLVSELRRSYTELRSKNTAGNVFVVEKKAQLEAAEKTKKNLEKADPRLAKLKPTALASATGAPGVLTVADKIAIEEDEVSNLTNKIRLLQDDMAQIHGEATNLDALTPQLHELERQVELRENNYKTYFSTLEQKKIENDIDGSVGKNVNIEVTQRPSPPSLERSKTPKMMGVAAIIGILAGLIWAFFVELYLDHSVRRPKEIEGSLGMRLFLSIPDVARNGSRQLGNGVSKKDKKSGKAKPEALLTAPPNGAPADGAAAANGTPAAANGSKLEVAPWDRNHSLHAYNEALRDRLISYFEVNNLNHKPKLVAVTGSAEGAGTTSIAAGLAASLSETGDGNVLLIDMNLEHGATQEFYNGKPNCELDAALANETRDSAMVQNNLYVVSGRANGDQLSRMLPKRFANLLPKLKASDYDYIIFDMPPIARTGVTQRLAGFMDMMLLVVEAEKTSRDVVKQAGALLTESKANVSVVLNKTRTYIPKRFHQEF